MLRFWLQSGLHVASAYAKEWRVFHVRCSLMALALLRVFCRVSRSAGELSFSQDVNTHFLLL